LPSLHTDSPDGHATAHLPAVHAWPAGHAVAHAPQLSGSVCVSTHALLHSVCALVHVGVVVDVEPEHAARRTHEVVNATVPVKA
jgi:hypothetical protein